MADEFLNGTTDTISKVKWMALPTAFIKHQLVGGEIEAPPAELALTASEQRRVLSRYLLLTS